MKSVQILLVVILLTNLSFAQTTFEKSVQVNPGQEVKFEFTWPELVIFRTWDKGEIKIVAKVVINRGQNDDAFNIAVNQASDNIMIASIIEDYKNLPRKIIINKDGQEYFFDSDDRNSPEIRTFKKENEGSKYNYMQEGVIIDIVVEVWVPNNISIDVYSKFGLIEVVNFPGKLTAHSKFGGIDLATNGSIAIKAGTKFGEKYTNLTSNVTSLQVGSYPGKWDWVQLGKPDGSLTELKSEFGNIYIRKD